MHSTVVPSGVRMHYSGNTSSHKNRKSVLERLSLVRLKLKNYSIGIVIHSIAINSVSEIVKHTEGEI